MDPSTINIAAGILSTVMMMAAIIYILTYILGTFSSRSVGGMPTKFVVVTLLYFFGSAAILFFGVEWLSGLARVDMNGIPYYLNIGASGLALNALLHISCGILTALLYLRGQMSQRQTLHRVRTRIRSRD